MTMAIWCGYIKWIYQFEQSERCNIEGTHRYVIGAFKEYPPNLKKVLICIGLNPNDGIPGRLEKTVQAINDFAFGNEIKFAFDDDERNKLPSWPLDGWIMLNLSPIRCGNSDSLSSMIDKDKIYEKAHKRNIKIIKSILERYPDAVRLAGWGTKIDDISYLRDTLEKIIIKEKEIKEKEEDIKWYCCYLPSDQKKAIEKKQKELEKIKDNLTQKIEIKRSKKQKKENIEEKIEKMKKEIEKYISQLSKTKKRDQALEENITKLENMKKEIENIEAGLTQKGHPRHHRGRSLKKAVINKFDISSYNPN